MGEGSEIHINAPSDDIPGFADVTELGWPGTGVTIGHRKTGATDLPGGIREYQIAGRDFAEEIVETVTRAVALAFGRPDIAPIEFVAEGLLVVDPSVTHENRRSLCKRLASVKGGIGSLRFMNCDHL